MTTAPQDLEDQTITSNQIPGDEEQSFPHDAGGESSAIEESAGVLIDPISDEVLTLEPQINPVAEEMHLDEEDSDQEIVQKLRRQGVRIGQGMISPGVIWPALSVILTVVAVAVFFPDWTGRIFGGMQGWIVSNFSWYYILVISFFVVFVIAIAVSPLGKVKLGRDGDKPEFGVMSWFSMLFAAGMGIGLVFYGVGEPLIYATVSPKPGWDGSQQEIAGLAMAQTFVHWGLHPWSIYAVIGLALAYAIHRRGRPVSIRWALEPLLGDRVKGWAGDVIDVLAIFGTVFGIATSLGLGVGQISAGLEQIGVVGRVDMTLLIVLIIGITFLATMSVVSGIGAGIKWLSNINLSLAGVLLVSMLVLGPTIFLLENFVQSLGYYFANVFQMSLDVGAYSDAEGHAWFQSWTVFYWGWWISWAPFVGLFIARISRGRTVRQFITGVLLVPSLVGFIWFSVLGGSGLYRQFFGAQDLVDGDTVEVEGVLFKVLEGLPLGGVLSILGIILVAIFFITSSDSGSLVIDMLASGGHPNPPTWSRVLWSAVEGMVAIALLIAGGLVTLQAASLATALPFSVVLVLMCVAIYKGLAQDLRKTRFEERAQTLDRAASHISDQVMEAIPGQKGVETYIDDRIDYRLSRGRRPVRGPRRNSEN